MNGNFTMEFYRHMAVFAAVVELGSMRQAGRRLGMSTSAVSQHVRQLEHRAQVTLLKRTTRRQALTAAGEAFYQACRQMVAAADAARAQLTEIQNAPVGELVISAPSTLATTQLPAALAPLVTAHRALSLKLFVADERFDAIDQPVDLALVVGLPPASDLVMHKLAEWELVLVASPRYLASHGVPRDPSDLSTHEMLRLALDYVPDVLTLETAGRPAHPLPLTGRLASNNQLTLKRMALDGLGISVQAREEIELELREGRLLRVLSHWSCGHAPLVALTVPRAHQPAKVRYALDALRRHFGAAPTFSASSTER